MCLSPLPCACQRAVGHCSVLPRLCCWGSSLAWCFPPGFSLSPSPGALVAEICESCPRALELFRDDGSSLHMAIFLIYIYLLYNPVSSGCFVKLLIVSTQPSCSQAFFFFFFRCWFSSSRIFFSHVCLSLIPLSMESSTRAWHPRG